MQAKLPTNDSARACPKTGWTSRLAKACFALLLLEFVTGVAIWLAPFHAATQWTVLGHTVAGLILLLPLAIYGVHHLDDYRRYGLSHIVLLGQVALWGLLVCLISGAVLTWQGLFGLRTTPLWRQTHLYSTFVAAAGVLPHVLFSFLRVLRGENAAAARRFLWQSAGACVVGVGLMATPACFYSGIVYNNAFPQDYQFVYGTNRPFAPSLATTDTGGAFDERSLSGSLSCGTAGCHQQILHEWLSSAHRYAAMDPVFQGIQNVMARQNGPESTRYCGGCHDPISLFSGSKNLFAKDLTTRVGYQEGISCLVCHAIRKTDVQGNAHYTVTQPPQYLWQWKTNGPARIARDFLIRTYPSAHDQLAKRAYRRPEYCAACHKQFIDKEVNRVGWVQLQNQYDNWASSHWNHKGDARKTIECRECHMPLVASHDPAAGDALDYNRSPDDHKHRSHRFLAANELIPEMLKLPGWKEQVRLTERWLQGRVAVPEIQDKWHEGRIVTVALDAPSTIAVGKPLPVRVLLTSNKVGHDFPTGPLDIIQSWLEVTLTDAHGRCVFQSGTVDTNHFIAPGSFLFKAEPVDQYGNLIDRHNLWEMVGVRFKRAIFPGYTDSAQYTIPCTGMMAADRSSVRPLKDTDERSLDLPAKLKPGRYQLTARLLYRKVDQFLLNYLFGKNKTIAAPVTVIDQASMAVTVEPRS